MTPTTLTVSGSGSLVNNGTLTGATVIVNSGDSITNGSSGVASASGVVTVNSSATLTNNGTMTITGTLVGAGQFVSGANATLNINNAAAPTITTMNLTTNKPNTVNYALGGAQGVRVETYSNLILSTSGIKTAGGAITVNGTFTLTGTAAFTTGAFTHTFAGSWVHDTTVATPLVATGSVIVFSTPSPAAATSITGTGTQPLAFVGLTVSNSSGFTLSKPITVTGLMTVSATFTAASAGTIGVSGTGAVTVSNSVTFNNASTLTNSGSGTLTVSDGATFSNTGTVNVSGTGAILVGSTATATFSNTGSVTAGGTLEGFGQFINGANSTLTITNADGRAYLGGGEVRTGCSVLR